VADAAVHAPAVGHDDHGAHHTSTGLSNNKLAMWLFLGSECLLFGGLISTYMLYRGRHSENLGPDQLWDIPFTSASSFVLLMSSLTMVLAVTAAKRRDDRNTNLWLVVTALLGSLFVGGRSTSSRCSTARVSATPPACSRRASTRSPGSTACTSPSA
jgi:heme/copper-type cytochrome/quinol oxidase subunit 3